MDRRSRKVASILVGSGSRRDALRLIGLALGRGAS
jgi:hypothetical protein